MKGSSKTERVINLEDSPVVCISSQLSRLLVEMSLCKILTIRQFGSNRY
jgi:hypothetical protein